MKFIAQVLGLQLGERKIRRKSFAQYQQELLVKQGREQFRKLMKQGLDIPVAYL